MEFLKTTDPIVPDSNINDNNNSTHSNSNSNSNCHSPSINNNPTITSDSNQTSSGPRVLSPDDIYECSHIGTRGRDGVFVVKTKGDHSYAAKVP